MILKSLFLQPLGPALVLAIAGILLALARRFGRGAVTWFGAQVSRSGRWLPRLYGLRLPFALLALLIAAAILVWSHQADVEPFVAWQWQPLTVAGSTLEWRLNGWNWLVSVFIVLLTGVALLLDEDRPQPPSEVHGPALVRGQRLDLLGTEHERTLWLAAGALIFVTSANVLTLACGWVVLDAALTFRLRPGLGAEPAARAWSLLTLAALLLLVLLVTLGESGLRASLTGQTFTTAELALLWAVALIRTGIYPLHFWLTGPGNTRRSERIALSLIVPTTGLWLLVRVHDLAGPSWLRRPEWAALGALALLGTALVAWTTEDEAWRWRWIALNRGGLVVMSAYVAGLSGPEALVWPMVAFVLGCGLLSVGQELAAQTGLRGFAWLPAFLIWGFPGTPGFLARTGLVFPTELPVAAPLFGLVLLAEVLMVAALWQAAAAARPRPSQPPQREGSAHRLRLAFALLLVPLLFWGLMPRFLAGFVGSADGEAFRSLGATIWNARRSVWVGLILSAGLGIPLGLFRERVFDQMRGWQSAIAAIVSLDWLYEGLVMGLVVLGNGLRYFAVLGEGEGYLGWLALAAFILWVLLRG